MTEDRTWLASVLFLDIVGYSKVPVDQQLSTKLNFNNAVSCLLGSLEREECIHLDTGDGCAICYLGDPEKIYPIAVKLQQKFFNLDQTSDVCYQVRLGLNLGPIKIIKDLNGERNCIGNGINDAQRVMGFAEDNQLLVSRSYYDIVSSLSSLYTDQLSAAGARADKHNKVHEIFELNNVPIDQDPAGVNRNGFHLEDTIRERLLKEYARYVGTNTADAVIQKNTPMATSVGKLCDLLAAELSEDDRYHFLEYTRFYGYST